jgi:hypothetical protein
MNLPETRLNQYPYIILSWLLKKVSFLAFQAVSYGAFGMPQFSTTQCDIDSRRGLGTKYIFRSDALTI